jgi:hypothetical protein
MKKLRNVVSFFFEVELHHFLGSEERDQNVNIGSTYGLGFIEKSVITSSWVGHDADLPSEKSLNGVNDARMVALAF